MAVPIQSCQEAAIVVSNLDRSKKFYIDVVGMKPTHHVVDNGVVLDAGGFALGIYEPGGWVLPKSDNWAPVRLEHIGRAHFVLKIKREDLDTALAGLQQHGVKYYGPRQDGNGNFHIDFEDPDGHMMEYHT
jgi:catechol 2,3-dioxygenase-like lactoylglutathione lyase family enzyme